MGWIRGLVLSGVLVGLCSAQVAEPLEPVGKTAEYYKILLKRPRSGYLFDRFCNSWLEQNDLARLETLLAGSEDPSARYLLAFLHERMNDPEKASRIYSELLAASPNDADLLFYKAGVDAERGLHASAAEGLARLVGQEEVGGDLLIKALKLRGRCLLRDGRTPEGLAVWQRLLDASGMDEDVADEVVDLLLAEGLYQEALDLCDRMLSETKDAYRNVMIRMRRATLLVRMDRRKEAIDGLCEVFGSTGQGSWLQRDLLERIEMLYRGSDDLVGLSACLGDMLTQWPDNPGLRRARSEVLLACRKDKEALDVARELVRLVPDSQEIKAWYVDLLLELDRNDEAVAMVEGFLQRFPDDNALRLQLASIHQRRKDDAKTVECIVAFLEHSPGAEADYLQAARTLARYDLNDEATSIFLEMLAKWPDSMEGREAVAMHMSRKSYLYLELAWKHYEWLARVCDLDTLLRLDSALKAARSPKRALTILDMRRDDFGGDYRYASARFDTIAATEEQTDLLEAGLDCVDLASAVEEVQSSVAALLYELKKRKLINEWIGRISTDAEPTPARLWLLASLHVSEKQADKAKDLLRAAAERDPADETAQHYLLLLAKQERDWELAETILVRLIEQSPAKQSAWIRELVSVLNSAGKYEASLEWIETWKKVSPNAIRPYEMEREVLLACDRQEDAVQRMRKAVLQFAESKELKRALGQLYQATGRLKEAEDLYWKMLDAEESLDERMSLLSNIIQIKQNSNGMNDLVRELERRAETARTAAFPLLGLAECHRINNRMNERREVLNRLLELRPSDMAVLRAKADLEEDLGNHDAARSLRLRIADADPTGSAFRKIVKYEFLYGDPSSAGEMLADPRIAGDADVFIELVSELVGSGCEQGIMEALEKQMEEHPEDYRFAYLRGILLKNRGESSEAFQIFSLLFATDEERPGFVEKKQNALASATARSSATRYTSRNLQQHATTTARWQLAFGTVVPPELMAMYSLGVNRANFANNMGRGNSGQQASPRLDVPEDLSELKLFCALQMLETGVDLAPELRAHIEETVPYVGMLWMDPALQINTVTWWNAVQAMYPDDEAVTLFRVCVSPQSIESNDEMSELIERIAKDYPELAFQTILQFGYRNPDLFARLPELVAMIGLSDENLDQVFNLVLQMLSRTAADKALPSGMEDLFTAVEAGYMARDTLDDFVRLKLAVFGARLNGDYAPVKVLLKSLFERIGEVSSSPGSGADSLNTPSVIINGAYYTANLRLVSGGQFSYYAGLESFHFPPSRFPSGNVVMLQFSPASIGLDQKFFIDAVMELPPDSLARWLMLARFVGGDEEQLKQSAVAVASKESKTDNELYALANWYAVRQEMEPALASMLELRARADDDPAMQTTFDRVLLRTVAQMDEVPESLKPQLKELVGSLKKSVGQDHSMLIQLVKIMDKLDMPIDDLVQLASSQSSRAMQNLFAGSNRVQQKNVYQQIVDQIKQGETDTALLRAAVLVRAEAQRTIYATATRSQSSSQVRNCLQYIRQQKLVDRFLPLLAPPEEGRSALGVYEYAYALDSLGRKDEADSAYREVYAMRPDWVGAKIRYCMGLMAEDREAALQMLEGCPPDQIESIFNLLQQMEGNGALSFEARLSTIEMAIALMDKNGKGAGRSLDLNRFYNLHGRLLNEWYERQDNGENMRLPGLYHTAEEGSLAPGWVIPKDSLTGQMAYWQSERLVALQQRRRECAIGMLKNFCVGSPQYGLDAFEKLTAYLDYTHAEFDEDELFQLARGTLAKANSYNRRNDSSLRGTAQNALEYYVLELHRRQDWSDAKQLLGEMKNAVMQRGLQNLVDLQNPDDAAGTKEDRLEKILYGSGNQRMVESILMGLAFRIYSMDGGNADLEAMVLRILDRKKKDEQNIQNCVPLLNAWVAASGRVDRPVDLEAAYSRLLSGMFSEQEQEVIAKASPGSIDGNNHQKIYQKYQQMASAFNEVELPPEAIRVLLAQTAPVDEKMKQAQMTDNLLNQNRDKLTALDWVERMGLIDDWDSFPFHLLIGGQQSLMWQVFGQLESGNASELRKAINAMENPTFGVLLLKCFAGNTSSSQRPVRLFSALAPYKEQLESDSVLKNRIFHWMKNMVLSGKKVPETSDFSKDSDDPTVLNLYADWDRQANLDYLAELESIKLSSIMQDPYTTLRRAGQALRILAQDDPERARALFGSIIDKGRVSLMINGQQNEDRNLLQYLFEQGGYTEGEFALATMAVEKMGSSEALGWFAEQYCNAMFDRVQQRHRERGMDSSAAQLQAFKDCIVTVMPMGDRVPVAVYVRWLQRMNQKFYPELSTWLGELGDKPDGVEMIRMLLDPGEEDEAQIESYLFDKEIAVEERLQTYAWIPSRFFGKLALFQKLDFNFGMLDLYDQTSSMRIPQHVYHRLLEQVKSSEAGEERDARADRLIQSWTKEKVDGAPDNVNTLQQLVGFSGEVGRADVMRGFLEHPEMLKRSNTYALALRHGQYDWVAEQLPRNLLNLPRRSLDGAEMWIPAAAVEHFASILDGVDDGQKRLAVRLFLFALPVKGEGNASVDRVQLELVLADADEQLEEPSLIKWTIESFGNRQTTNTFIRLKRILVQDADFLSVLKAANAVETEAFIAHVNGLFAKGDMQQIRKMVEQIDKPMTRDQIVGSERERLLGALLNGAADSDDVALGNKAKELLIRFEQLRNPSAGEAR